MKFHLENDIYISCVIWLGRPCGRIHVVIDIKQVWKADNDASIRQKDRRKDQWMDQLTEWRTEGRKDERTDWESPNTIYIQWLWHVITLIWSHFPFFGNFSIMGKYRRTDRWTDRWTDGPTDGRTDKAYYRDASKNERRIRPSCFLWVKYGLKF